MDALAIRPANSPNFAANRRLTASAICNLSSASYSSGATGWRGYGLGFVDGLLVFELGPSRLRCLRPACSNLCRRWRAWSGWRCRSRDCGEVGVENCSAVSAAARRLELLDDLHGATLGAPLSVPQEAGAERVDGCKSGLRAAFDSADDVHDVGVALDET